MKNILLSIGFFAMVQVSLSQTDYSSLVVINKQKKPVLFYSNSDTQTKQSLYLNNISIKAIRDLMQTYKDVTDEKWFGIPEGFQARFTYSDVCYRIDYDKKGNWLLTIRSYDEKEMTIDIRRRVKVSYFDYSITWIDEIIMPFQETIYFIHLEGKTDWINLRISGDEIDEWQRYNK